METHAHTESQINLKSVNIDVDRVVRDINANVADVLTRSLGPYIKMASESTAQCSAVSQVLRKLPEFQTLLEEKLKLAAEVSELRARLATAESSGIRLRVSELPSHSQFTPADTSIANLTQHLYGDGTISRAQSPSRDSLSDDESEEVSSDSEPIAASDMLIGMDGLLAAERRQPDSPYTSQSVASISDKDEEESVNTITREHDEIEEESREEEADSEDNNETINEENIAPSFPSHPLAAHIDITMEEEEEELYEIELVLPGDTDPTAFYTSDVDNGAIYEIADDESPGEEVGRLENGIPNWGVE